MLMTGSGRIDAQRAFTRLARARRRASIVSRLRRCTACSRLRVYDRAAGRASAAGGIREIPLDAISGTLEPSRAAQFDGAFRPVTEAARRRWERVWMAEDRGTILPPISVVPVGAGEYALLDGHHRVSVAHARGAVAIDATVLAR